MEALGKIRYQGEDLQDGVISSAEASVALRGLDRSLQWWISRYDRRLSDFDLPIPVRVNHGSWELELPKTVAEWLMTAGGAGATAYLIKAAQKLAERDFDERGLTDAFKSGFRGLKTAVKLGVHLGGLTKEFIKKLRWLDNNSFVEVESRDGLTLVVRTDDFQLFLEMPSGQLSDLISLVNNGRRMTLVSPDPEDIPVTIDSDDRAIFVVDDSEDESVPLFPELEHLMNVSLEGFVTRGNEVANSIGFRYLDHILTCYPTAGSIVRYKPLLFTPCLIEGTVSRLDEKNRPIAHRPQIRFQKLKPLRESGDQAEMHLD